MHAGELPAASRPALRVQIDRPVRSRAVPQRDALHHVLARARPTRGWEARLREKSAGTPPTFRHPAAMPAATSTVPNPQVDEAFEGEHQPERPAKPTRLRKVLGGLDDLMPINPLKDIHKFANSHGVLPSFPSGCFSQPRIYTSSKLFHALRGVAVAVFSSTAEADRLAEMLDQQHRQAWCGMLHPDTPQMAVYNQFHILLLLYMLAIMPARAALGITPTADMVQFWIDVFIDLAIAVDIFLNFHRYYWEKGGLIIDRSKIGPRYLRGWFVVDLMSVLPFNYIIMVVGSASDSNLAGTTRFMRFSRIMIM
jgi:hypothetical protein